MAPRDTSPADEPRAALDEETGSPERQGAALALAALGQMADGVILADAAGRITFVNEAARRLHGRAELGVPVDAYAGAYRLLTVDGAPFPSEALPLARAVRRGETVRDVRWRIRRPDGSEAVAEGSAAPLHDAGGALVGAVLTVRDVTVQAELEERLRASEERFRGLSASSPVGIFHARLDGAVTYANPRLAEIWDSPAESVLGFGWLARVHPDDRDALLAGWTAALAAGRDYAHAYRLQLADGRVRRVHGRSTVVRDGAGRATGTVGTIDDTTAEGEALAALAASERRFRSIFETVSAIGVVLDPDGRIAFVNDFLLDLTGHARERVLGSDWFALFVPEEIRDGLRDAYVTQLAEGRTFAHFENEIVARDGARRLVAWDNTVLHDVDGRIAGVASIGRDVTDDRATAARLAEREAEFRTMADNIPQLAWMADATGWIFWYNRRWYEYTGAVPDDMAGWGWRAVHHPAHVERVVTRFSRSIQTGEPWEDTFPLRGAGGRYRWFLSRALPICDARGEVVRWFGTNTDITEQLEAAAERERLLDEAERARVDAEAANDAKTQFLATMSHELRTPLNAVLGYTELLELGIAGAVSGQQREYLTRVRASAAHLLGLINDILDLSRVEAGQLGVRAAPILLERVMFEALQLVRPQAAACGLTIDERVDAAPAPDGAAAGVAAFADPDRVRQVAANLLSNAVKFTPAGGRVAVRVGSGVPPWRATTPAGGAPRRGGTPPEERRWAYLVVEDTGIGIPPESLQIVFEPFRQVEGSLTRRHGGSGLGLAISRELARLMGGELVVESTPGVGSAFTLWLPTSPLDAPMLARPTAEPPTRVAAAETPVVRPRLNFGRLLAASVTEVVAAFAERLRGDARVPGARGAARADLEDHVAAFLMDFAQTLTILDDPDSDQSMLLREGSQFQWLLALRHGAQRHALGWTRAALERELVVLGDELERHLRHTAVMLDQRRDALGDYLALLRQLLREAGDTSLLGYDRTARGDSMAAVARELLGEGEGEGP